MANLSTKSALLLLAGVSASSLIALFGPASSASAQTQYCLRTDKVNSTSGAVYNNNGTGDLSGNHIQPHGFGYSSRTIPSTVIDENRQRQSNVVPCNSPGSSGQPVDITNSPTNTNTAHGGHATGGDANIHKGAIQNHNAPVAHGGKVHLEKGAIDNDNKAYGGQVIDRSTHEGGKVYDHSTQHGGNAAIHKGAVQNDNRDTNLVYSDGGDSSVKNSGNSHAEGGKVKNSGNSYVGPTGNGNGNNNGNTKFEKGSLSPKSTSISGAAAKNEIGDVGNNNGNLKHVGNVKDSGNSASFSGVKGSGNSDNKNTNVGIQGQTTDVDTTDVNLNKLDNGNDIKNANAQGQGQQQGQQQAQDQNQTNIQGQATKVDTKDVNKVDNKQIGIQGQKTDVQNGNKVNTQDVNVNGQAQKTKTDVDASSENANVNGNANETGDQSLQNNIDASDRSVKIIKTEVDARQDARDTSVNIAPATPGITSLTVYNACGVPMSTTNVASQSEGFGIGGSQFGGLGLNLGFSWQSFNDQQKGMLEQMNYQLSANLQMYAAMGSSYEAMRPIIQNSYGSMFRRATDMSNAEVEVAVKSAMEAMDRLYLGKPAAWSSAQQKAISMKALMCGGSSTTTVVEQQPTYVPTTPTKAPAVSVQVPSLPVQLPALR